MLSMLYRNFEDYRAFHNEKPSELKWLDNSYNEQMRADEVKELAQLAVDSNASKVVCPDNPNWPTTEIERQFSLMVDYGFEAEELIVVVKNEPMYKDLLRSGVRNFACSYWTRPRTFKAEHMWMYRDVHFLGLLSIDELYDMEPKTCDTSMPIKLAMKGLTMKDWIAQGCPHINTKDLGTHGADFFTARLPNETIELARSNIVWLKEAVRDHPDS
jgi:hypothetical protein